MAGVAHVAPGEDVAAALATSASVVELEAGTHTFGTAVVVPNFKWLRGHGYGTNVVASTPLAEAIRASGTRCKVTDLRISGASGGGLTRGLHITEDDSSAQSIAVDGVYVEGNGYVGTGFAVAADSSLDVSEVNLIGNRAQACTVAGFSVGNGTPGNVLNVRGWGNVATDTVIGLLMSGGNATWRDSTMQHNTDADVVLASPTTAPIVIDGCRSELSRRFWRCTGSGTAARTITIANVACESFTDTDGVGFRHETSHPVFMHSCRFVAQSSLGASVVLGSNIVYPMSFEYVNIVFDGASALPASSLAAVNGRGLIYQTPAGSALRLS